MSRALVFLLSRDVREQCTTVSGSRSHRQLRSTPSPGDLHELIEEAVSDLKEEQVQWRNLSRCLQRDP